jgi:hypothetical protein
MRAFSTGVRVASVAAEQTGQAFRRKPLAPASDETIGAIQLCPNRGSGVTGIQQQDQPRTPRLTARPD